MADKKNPPEVQKVLDAQFMWVVWSAFKGVTKAGVALIINNDGTTQETKRKLGRKAR